MLALASCAKEVSVIEELPEPPSEAIREAVINIDVRTESSSKADGFTTSFDYEDKINSLQLLIFDSADSSLNFYQNLGTSMKGSASLYLGKKTVYVIANGPSLSSVSNLNQLNKKTFGLKEYNTNKGMIMTASAEVSLDDEKDVVLYLDRLAYRIYVTTVRNTLPTAYGTIKVKSAFLGNVPSAIGYSGGYVSSAALTNAAGVIDNPVYEFTCRTLNQDIASGATSQIAVPLYGYCNERGASDGGTFVSLEINIGGKDYYYTVYLNPEHLKANRTSDIQFNIVGLGAEDPSEVIEKAAVKYDIRINEWRFATSYSETI